MRISRRFRGSYSSLWRVQGTLLITLSKEGVSMSVPSVSILVNVHASPFILLWQVAEDPNMGADCPRLGDEPSFLQEPKKKVDVPGHRDTKDVLAQLTAEKKKEEKKATKHSLYN